MDTLPSLIPLSWTGNTPWFIGAFYRVLAQPTFSPSGPRGLLLVSYIAVVDVRFDRVLIVALPSLIHSFIRSILLFLLPYSTALHFPLLCTLSLCSLTSTLLSTLLFSFALPLTLALRYSALSPLPCSQFAPLLYSSSHPFYLLICSLTSALLCSPLLSALPRFALHVLLGDSTGVT